jgi:hypothetical protein
LTIKQCRGLASAFIYLEVRIGGIQLIDPVYHSVEPLHFVPPPPVLPFPHARRSRGAATFFMYLIAKLLVALFSIPFLGWGLMILFSDKYFARWQNTAWKERDSKQWSPENAKFNRYGRGLRAIIIGAGLLYIALFLN